MPTRLTQQAPRDRGADDPAPTSRVKIPDPWITEQLMKPYAPIKNRARQTWKKLHAWILQPAPSKVLLQYDRGVWSLSVESTGKVTKRRDVGPKPDGSVPPTIRAWAAGLLD